MLAFGALLAATSVALPSVAQAPANRVPEIHIPEVHGTSLTGQAVDLPAMLQGKAGVLIVGFSRESRDQAAAWGKRLAGDFGSSTDVAYYELPMLEDVPKLLRGVVLRAIVKDVSERGRPHFVPLTGNEAQWKAVTHFAEANDAYVLVVDGAGTVRWQVEGEPTDERYGAMRRAVAGVVGRSG